MTRLLTILLPLALVPAQMARAAEALIEPGEWKITSMSMVNGAVQPLQSKSRCITSEQAQDVVKTFGPMSGTINSACADPQVQSGGRTLDWRLQCRGQLDADVAGHFEFDSPQHYTAAVTSQGRMAGNLISDVKTRIVGERLGDCAK